jgi:hypothetical protein
METLGMKPMALLFAGLLLAGTAVAGDVYVTKDAQGHTIYTDTPQTIPAQKLDIHSQDPGAQGKTAPAKEPGQQQASANSQAPQPASQQTVQQTAQSMAEDRAKHCADARQQYQAVMNARRLYETGPNGERTFLTSEQIDQTRANAKQAMDEFCSGQ